MLVEVVQHRSVRATTVIQWHVSLNYASSLVSHRPQVVHFQNAIISLQTACGGFQLGLCAQMMEEDDKVSSDIHK